MSYDRDEWRRPWQADEGPITPWTTPSAPQVDASPTPDESLTDRAPTVSADDHATAAVDGGMPPAASADAAPAADEAPEDAPATTEPDGTATDEAPEDAAAFTEPDGPVDGEAPEDAAASTEPDGPVDGDTDGPVDDGSGTDGPEDRPAVGATPTSTSWAPGTAAPGTAAPGVAAPGAYAAPTSRPYGSFAPASPGHPVPRSPQPPPPGWDERLPGSGSPAGPAYPSDDARTADPPAPRRRGTAALLVVALLGGVIGAAAFAGIDALLDTPPEEPPPAAAPPDAPDETDTGGSVPTPDFDATAGPYGVVPAVAEAVTPSVVRIDVTVGGAVGPQMGPVGLGSGVIYRSDGYILTNHHVIDGAQDVTVRVSSGDILDAEIVGSDELNDLAVLRVDQQDLPAISFRPEDEPLMVGEMVVAIGSPFGLDASVTTGVISALNREIRLDEQDATTGAVLTIPSVIQTDAAINPGNSGGALVDAQGRLVGVNTAILTRSGASQGVGFAVSAEQALVSAEQLIEQGFVRHPLLGISGADVTVDIAEQFGLAASRGAVVESVQENSGAAAADVRPGDILVELDGEPLSTMSELVAEVRRREPGTVIRLGIVRGGQELTVEVELGERPRS